MKFKKQDILGVLGGSGFLLIIKGIIGLVESIMKRPSSHWRTDITVGNLLAYVIILTGMTIVVQTLQSTDYSKRISSVVLGVTLFVMALFFFLVFTVPFFQNLLFQIHPVILILAGAVLLPAMGNLSLRRNR